MIFRRLSPAILNFVSFVFDQTDASEPPDAAQQSALARRAALCYTPAMKTVRTGFRINRPA